MEIMTPEEMNARIADILKSVGYDLVDRKTVFDAAFNVVSGSDMCNAGKLDTRVLGVATGVQYNRMTKTAQLTFNSDRAGPTRRRIYGLRMAKVWLRQNRGVMHIETLYKPVRAVEFIHISFTLPDTEKTHDKDTGQA